MFSTEDLKTAIGATVIARRNAAARLREAGNPRDPFRALPGMEQQFFEAAQSVRSYDLVLNLLEREVKREARKRAGRTAQSAAAFIITAGLIILATLGFAAALLLMRCPVPAVSVTAFIGVAVSLGWRSFGSKSKNDGKGGQAMRGPKKRLTPFGKMVVKALADRDMSRAELAATVGTSPQYMSYILNGTRSGEKYLPAIIATLALDPKKAERAIAA